MSGIAPGALRARVRQQQRRRAGGGRHPGRAGDAGDERVVSPTQFHNSVHNAASGYWSIATASQQPATCIGCYDDTWPAALLTAMVELRATRSPVLLCCYDHPLPPPLDAVRPTGPAFAAALVLAPEGPGPCSRCSTIPSARPPPASLPDPALDRLARTNPAARALPLAHNAGARAAPGRHELPYLEGRLSLELAAARHCKADAACRRDGAARPGRTLGRALRALPRPLASRPRQPAAPRRPARRSVRDRVRAAGGGAARRAARRRRRPARRYAAASARRRARRGPAGRRKRSASCASKARLEAQERFGMVYAFEIRSQRRRLLLSGRASIALPR